MRFRFWVLKGLSILTKTLFIYMYASIKKKCTPNLILFTWVLSIWLTLGSMDPCQDT